MSTPNQSVAVWQFIYISVFLGVMGPASSSRNLPMQKIFSFRQKTKAFIAFEEFIGKIAIENPTIKRCFSLLFYSKMLFIPISD
jgi:hypothetical protein